MDRALVEDIEQLEVERPAPLVGLPSPAARGRHRAHHRPAAQPGPLLDSSRSARPRAGAAREGPARVPHRADQPAVHAGPRRCLTGAPLTTPAPATRRWPNVPARPRRENPWPVRALSRRMAEYIARSPAAWIEGQLAQVSVRPGAATAFLTLRDPAADMSLSVSCCENDPDRPGPAAARGRPGRRLRQVRVLPGPRVAVAAGHRAASGRPRRAAGPAAADPRAAGRRGAHRRRAARRRCRSCPARSA